MSAVNLKQIAEQAGVSLATASRVLSGSDYPVKEELRQRVLQVASELDYVPNANARGLLRGRSSTVGVLVGDVSDPFFSGMVGGIHEVAGKAGYMVTVVNTFREPETELDTLRRLRAQRVDIMIVAGSGLDDEAYTTGLERSLGAFMKSGNAAVLIGHHEVSDELPACHVRFDNRAAAREVAEHLHGLGHRRIALITGDPRLLSTRDRCAGFRDVFGDDLVCQETEPTRDGGYEAAARILDEHPDVTAIAATADQMALGALVQLRERGIAVPGKISVAGFNDIEVSKDLVPSLTSAHVPLDEMGRRAMELGLKALEGEVAHFEVQPQLAIRESTGPVRTD
ncbi:LacI family DNA-binding transcriptional regulator [Tessaracoccus oleiagri]|uniref:Transcriptional regulator, LacI family n=1 Tax=Tessaracoccus oleiagri TaxID=686624 RepID=A0A1G9HHP8_9ACTN|nr:LacI family DNA-binding transcriptional regulator [Tessaracoccus oleiagri]SDL12033.1 transcriptional regulator, LacI family [Tessaracoccus oleiagri]